MVDKRKTVAFSKFRLYTSWVIKNILLYYLRILMEKILYLCILIPLSEYIRTCHWETIFQFRYFKITVTTWYQKRLLYCEILGLVTVTNWLIERLTWLTYKLTNWITDLLSLTNLGLTEKLASWLSDIQTERLTGWLSNWLACTN